MKMCLILLGLFWCYSIDSFLQTISSLSFSEAESHFAFFEEFLAGLIHLAAGEIVNGEAIDNLPVATWSNSAREWVHNTLGYAILVSIRDHSHAGPLFANSSEPEIVDVITCSSGSRSSWTLAQSADDLSASLLDLGEEWTIEVSVVIDDVASWLALDGAVVGVWVLGGGVIAPDNDVIDLIDGSTFESKFNWKEPRKTCLSIERISGGASEGMFESKFGSE